MHNPVERKQNDQVRQNIFSKRNIDKIEHLFKSLFKKKRFSSFSIYLYFKISFLYETFFEKISFIFLNSFSNIKFNSNHYKSLSSFPCLLKFFWDSMNGFLRYKSISTQSFLSKRIKLIQKSNQILFFSIEIFYKRFWLSTSINLRDNHFDLISYSTFIWQKQHQDKSFQHQSERSSLNTFDENTFIQNRLTFIAKNINQQIHLFTGFSLIFFLISHL